MGHSITCTLNYNHTIAATLCALENGFCFLYNGKYSAQN
jgi:hypothetical protein